MPDESSVLTLEEAASVLRIAPSTARSLAARNELPGAFKLGGQWRVRKARLIEFIDSAA